MNHIKSLAHFVRLLTLAFAVTFLAAACQSTPRVAVTLPPGTLSAEEIHELFIGKTVKSITVAKGRVSESYYDPNGEIRQLRNGERRSGHWRITDDARICLKMGYFGKEGCRIIVKEQGGYKKYIVKLDGNHVPAVSYQSFQTGNPLGL